MNPPSAKEVQVMLWTILPGLALILAAGAAQDPGQVEAMSGQITVSAVADRSGALVELAPQAGGARVILFLQYRENGTPLPEYAGTGKLFLGSGFVGIAGDDGNRMAARFPGRAVPASLKTFAFKEFEIAGIARYPGSVSEAQLANLKTLGLCTPAAKGLEAQGGARPLQVDGCPGLHCTSGGEGAIACSTGSTGCSVECSTGRHACCDGNTNNCRCCKNAP
jgi:hypothetical protein